jgi:phage tail tape-measure protein
MLVEQARLCIGAHEEGDFVQAFSYIEGAHAMIQAGLARGVVSSEEIAVRLHRSFDLIGAMVATNPVEAP